MFHGIVTGRFPIVLLEEGAGLSRLTIELSDELIVDLKRGASVAVDGVCLTVADLQGKRVSFDVMAESLNCSALKYLKQGDQVNIERSARPGDEIGGHLVSGHVDGMARIVSIETPPNNYIVTLALPVDLIKYVFRKGFISINGASLTIAEVDRCDGWLRIWLIPETLRLTTFPLKKVDDFVNVEVERNTQVIVDTVLDFLENRLGVNKKPEISQCEAIADTITTISHADGGGITSLFDLTPKNK
jgi:riboflavin synthase